MNMDQKRCKEFVSRRIELLFGKGMRARLLQDDLNRNTACMHKDCPHLAQKRCLLKVNDTAFEADLCAEHQIYDGKEVSSFPWRSHDFCLPANAQQKTTS